MKATVQEVEDFYMNIIRDTVDYRVKNNVKRHDFVDMLIEMKLKFDNGDKENGLTFNEIAAQAFIFFLAGFETSSTTMGFALYELACHQDIQDKLRTEINTVLKQHNGKLDYDSMREMTYLEKVIDGKFHSLFEATYLEPTLGGIRLLRGLPVITPDYIFFKLLPFFLQRP